MKSEGVEIRDILNKFRTTVDANKSMLSENYVFPSDSHVKSVEENGVPSNLRPEMKPEVKIDPIKDKINSIRKTAISLMGEIEPTEMADEYKAIRTILDACDKLIAVKPVEKNRK